MRLTTFQQRPITKSAPQSGLKPPRPFAQPSEPARQVGLPGGLKAVVERFSGLSLDDVRVRYNSPAPSRYHAHAHTQGTEIHLGAGQERHLAHEAWHVVQQKQGRVRPTARTPGGVPVNDDGALEREADVMGARAVASAARAGGAQEKHPATNFVAGATARPDRSSRRFAPRPHAHDAPVQGKWIIRGGKRVQVHDDYELQPGESTPEGLRRRVIPPKPTPPPPVSPKPTPSPSLRQRFDQVGGVSGNLGTVASVAEHLHANPVSEAIAHVPILGAVSSANTSVRKREQSQQAYLRGNLGEAARHGIGSVASGIKSVADTATVATGGLASPLTVPVSTAASLVNTATSLPEYAQTASSVVRDPMRTASQLSATAASVPDTLSSLSSSVSNYLFGTTPTHPQSAEQQERQRQQEEHERLQRAKAKANRLKFSKYLIDKLD